MRLGTTVAKTAADIWLGGRRRQRKRQLSLTEPVRLRVPGLRLQRRVERQFGQIIDAVFDRPALAAVGSSLLRSLPRSLGELTEKAAAQTVRTVALIGGAEALGLLARYAEDTRRGVVEALIEAWGTSTSICTPTRFWRGCRWQA
ncbi:hypothetical protein ABZ281_15130 [Streptomyces sp. NPDC006265]|uniref:NACHT N-terminal Helical domain 1-containing protein n=1 Tax=Streptomyces sp. NPDC006265 TaxID=3156740 RepID=UPI0033A14ACB